MTISSCTKDRVTHGHPCFGENRHKNGRIHVAGAPLIKDLGLIA